MEQNNKLGSNRVIDLYVFDTSGELIARVDTLKGSLLDLRNETGSLFVRDALLNIDLLKFAQDTKDKDLTDYERYLKLHNNQTIVFNAKNRTKECRLIAKTIMRNQSNGKDVIVMYEVPKAFLIKNYEFKNDFCEVSVFDAMFQFYEYNEDGDILKMHIIGE